MYCVYEAEYENGIYVGETGNFKQRKRDHLRNKKKKTPFYCALRTHKFKWRIVLGARTEEDALHCEIQIIAQHRAAGKRVLNLTDGGEMPPSHKGKKRRPETLAKMAEVRLGKKIHTPESKAKIAEAARKRVVSAETRAKMSAARKGRPRPPEVRAKIAAGNLGKVKSPETRAKISAAVRAANQRRQENS